MNSDDPPAPDDTTDPAATAARPLLPLTRRQSQIFEFICQTVKARGYPPSIREIGGAVGLSSSSSIARQLKQLQAKGHIAIDSRSGRAYRVLSHDLQTGKALPVQHAGCPLLTDDQQEEEPGGSLVLTVVLDPAIRRALLNGASVTVQRLPGGDNRRTPHGDTTLLGQITAITHPVLTTPG
ncbi:LexA family protein [Streptomyces sp. NPDC090106]|uniref:LexA family protein n=1 Tax=Streptomyces sp. NPDC090106 TaxID=3365946 RepID=UPI0038138A81